MRMAIRILFALGVLMLLTIAVSWVSEWFSLDFGKVMEKALNLLGTVAIIVLSMLFCDRMIDRIANRKKSE